MLPHLRETKLLKMHPLPPWLPPGGPLLITPAVVAANPDAPPPEGAEVAQTVFTSANAATAAAAPTPAVVTAKALEEIDSVDVPTTAFAGRSSHVAGIKMASFDRMVHANYSKPGGGNKKKRAVSRLGVRDCSVDSGPVDRKPEENGQTAAKSIATWVPKKDYRRINLQRLAPHSRALAKTGSDSSVSSGNVEGHASRKENRKLAREQKRVGASK